MQSLYTLCVSRCRNQHFAFRCCYLKENNEGTSTQPRYLLDLIFVTLYLLCIVIIIIINISTIIIINNNIFISLLCHVLLTNFLRWRCE